MKSNRKNKKWKEQKVIWRTNKQTNKQSVVPIITNTLLIQLIIILMLYVHTFMHATIKRTTKQNQILDLGNRWRIEKNTKKKFFFFFFLSLLKIQEEVNGKKITIFSFSLDFVEIENHSCSLNGLTLKILFFFFFVIKSALFCNFSRFLLQTFDEMITVKLRRRGRKKKRSNGKNERQSNE